MFDYKTLLGVLAVVVGFVGYYPYVRDVLRGTTRPHVFSWFVWGTLETIAFFAQIAAGGGAGAWVTGASVIIIYLIFLLALRSSDKQIKLMDVLALGGAIIGIILWRITSNPLTAVISVTAADALGFAPTYRKAFYRPNEETIAEFALSALKWLIAIPALANYNLATWLYPASLILSNTCFVIMVSIRRRQLFSATVRV